MEERTPFEVTEKPSTKDDRTLLSEIGTGDEDALRDLYDRHKFWLAARLRQRMSADAVEDVLQETFLAIWKSASSFQASGEVAAWMWGIARRQSALWYRKHGNEQRAAELLTEQIAAHDDVARSVANKVDLGHAFVALTPSARNLAQQAFVEDKSIRELSLSLDIPQGTVKSRIFHLRKKLSMALGKDHQP